MRKNPKEKALSDAKVTAEQAGKVRARVSQMDDGTVIYKVKFTFDGQKYSYKINAVTGEVIDKSTETATEDTASEDTASKTAGQEKKKTGKQKTAEKETAAGQEKTAESGAAGSEKTAESDAAGSEGAVENDASGDTAEQNGEADKTGNA